MKNHLADSLSPYLLQHSENPVNWFPWGDEAFQKAKREDKPIFLSIGYASCHWCHVMAHESFENETVAQFLNAHFVCIKVDREERPDVDDIYMNAVQMLTGSGGWPLSVFLTPDLKPFYGGTYFPPERGYGRPSFLELLDEINRTYRSRRSLIINNAAQITAELQNMSSRFVGSYAYDRSMIDGAVQYLSDAFDGQYGGFGSAPKFPPTGQLNMLMRAYYRQPDDKLLAMVEHTLTKMAQGGIFDQIGGGFHRYSVDERWLTPHFEKMLYDNALLTVNYLDLFQTTENEFYADVARKTLDWALREMLDASGGFYSSLDADSEGREGLFYVWKHGKVAELFGNESQMVSEAFGITEKGNFEDNSNILTLHPDLKTLGEKYGLTLVELKDRIQSVRQKMLQHRASRIRPGTDDKILADWNSLMVTALARAYRVLGDERYLKAAENAADFVLDTMRSENELFHSHRNGVTATDGMLDDYAYLSEALLELYQANFNEKYFREAKSTVNKMLKLFWDDDRGGFYQVQTGKADLLYRIKQGHDSATPSGNAIAARALFTLYQMTDDENYRKYAEQTARHYTGQAAQYPAAFFRMIALIDDLTSPMKQIAIIRANETIDSNKMIKVLNDCYLPGSVVVSKVSGQTSIIPLLANRELEQGLSTAYYCVDFTCQLPTKDVNELASMLGKND